MATLALEPLPPNRLRRRATDGGPPRPRERRHPVPEPRRARTAGVAPLFPGLRPCDHTGGHSASRRSWELEPHASVSAWIVSEGLEVLDPAARRRIIDGWRTYRSRSGSTIVVDEGCDVEIGPIGADSRTRGALLEWLRVAPDELAVYEGGLFRHAPAAALTLLLRPPTIWSIEDALTARACVPAGLEFTPGRFAALERAAGERVGRTHVARLREAVDRIERQLPIAEFPTASRTIAAGCTTLARDDRWCGALAARQLARYASSVLVRREANRRLRASGMRDGANPLEQTHCGPPAMVVGS